MERPAIYGVMAEFDSPEELVRATEKAREAGYRRMDAYSPFAVEELGDILQARSTSIPLVVLGGAITGAIAGYGLQYWTMAVDYPVDVGGRPFNSIPAFIPVTFEMIILFSVLAAVLGMLALNGLPMPYHPVFNVPAFARASQDRFFLVIEARDPKFEYEKTRTFLQGLGAHEVSDVPH
jgi:hypothetical protein